MADRISGWPHRDMPDPDWLAYTIEKLEEADALAGELEYRSYLVANLTIEELLGGLEFARYLMQGCVECRKSLYVGGEDGFYFTLDGALLCEGCMHTDEGKASYQEGEDHD